MKWIPISESLPDKNMKYVFCTAASGSSDYRYYTGIKEYIYTQGFGEMEYNEYYESKDEDSIEGEYYFRPEKVIAWAPIPSLKSKIWNSYKTPPEKDYGPYDNLVVARKTTDGFVYEKCLYCKDGKDASLDESNPIKNSFGYIQQSEYDCFPEYCELKDVVAWMIAPDPYTIPRPTDIEYRMIVPIDEIINGEIQEFDYYAWQPLARYDLMERLKILSMALCYDKRIDVYDIKDNKCFKIIIRNSDEKPKEYYLADKDFTIECKKLKYGMHMNTWDKHKLINRENVIINKILFKYSDAKYLFPDDFLLEETYKWINAKNKAEIEKSWNEIAKREKEYKKIDFTL